MDLVAKNPMEQMKKNLGKPYLNKIDVLIEPAPIKIREDIWASLMAKCKANDIAVEGMEMGEQSIEEIEQLDKWVDETITENK